MTTLNKTFSSAFGNTYKMDIIDKKTAINIINEIDQENVLETLISKHSTDGETLAYLNLESKEIEYHHFIGNTDLQQKEHLILLESISGNLEEGLTIEDFLDDKEIENAGSLEKWDVIKQLPDYDNRLVEAWKFYYNGFNMEYSINEQINKVYDH